MDLDLTAPTASLASAVADVTRLLPTRVIEPVLTGIVLRGDADGVTLSGTDRERGIRLWAPATCHVDGEVLVPAKPLAETLRTVDTPEIRLVVEGSRLALRTPQARFALPLLELDAHPGVPAPPARLGGVSGAALRAALAPVAAAASRDDALPVFTGVRIASEGDRLVLMASDRFRLATARLPWRPVDETPLDVLLPAATLTEVLRRIPDGAEVGLHADEDRAALTWERSCLITALLATAFPSTDRLLSVPADTTAWVEADVLAGAIRRALPYTGPHGLISLEVGDAELRVRGVDSQTGESEEMVKAAVDGGRPTRRFQARNLADGLKAFAGGQVRLAVPDADRRGTVLTGEARPDEVELTYLVAPSRGGGH
ncbi:DNA polymerase-3 subunit beta [Actinoalloteichus hoggarensis]|uniref:DNA polymerase III subunit beta n=1 Tax=Actinoalloteichus hoggarensis TaxID=1470176 RepID=A0A221VWI3_9PSEU|nr:DNA polymerase III subunit beta [Actinoalloteichus hoggarensis]ASO17910.1 DNA polymerase III subunit beta [Actinoalloteichus hoggarensis]MBB5924321.1 DNA polymerase-3 subunit beta [Actinoalloteichus hoggarensis]